MAQIEDAIALGIGPQTAKGAVNVDVQTATELIAGPASASGATGILLRNPEDLSKSMERIQTDLGTVTGSRTRVTGGLIRIVPTVSFDIDAKGNGFSPATPTSPEFDALEYMLQIFEGARLLKGTSGGTSTPYEFGIPATTEQYKTIKIWRGKVQVGQDEAWVLHDCTFNLTWSFVAGEKAVLTVDVFAGVVEHLTTTTFPPAPDFSTQIDSPPILSLAAANIDGVERGFTSASLAIAYPEIDVPDSNVDGGVTKEIGSPRDVQFSADWYADTASDDFLGTLQSDIAVPVFFTLGQIGAAGELINAWRFDMPLFRGETTDKVDAESNKVVRTITGYASHTTADAELVVTAV